MLYQGIIVKKILIASLLAFSLSSFAQSNPHTNSDSEYLVINVNESIRSKSATYALFKELAEATISVTIEQIKDSENDRIFIKGTTNSIPTEFEIDKKAVVLSNCNTGSCILLLDTKLKYELMMIY